MKKAFRTIAALLLVTCSLPFISFSDEKGGEGFEIYLNNKMVVQQFSHTARVQLFSLDKVTAADQLKIKYYHCGRLGKNRVVQVRNEKNIVLKVWKFPDARQPDSWMILPAREISVLQQNNKRSLVLYYQSSELVNAKPLAKLSVTARDITSK